MHTEYTKETRNVSKINKSSWNSSLVLIALRRTGTYMISVSANIHHHMKCYELSICQCFVFSLWCFIRFLHLQPATWTLDATNARLSWRSTFRKFLASSIEMVTAKRFNSLCCTLSVPFLYHVHTYIVRYGMDLPSFHLIFYVISLQAMEIRPAKIYWQIWLMEKGCSHLNIFTHNSVNNTKMI